MICANKLLPSRLPPSCFYKKQVQIIQILQPISKAKRERKRKQRGRERQKELTGYAEEEEERKMVNYMLKITAEVENVKSLQPMGGCDDPNFTFYFKLRCENCGEVTPKETAVSLEEQVPLPKSRGHAHLLQKCKFCGREGNITMTPGSGRPLTDEHCEEGKYAPLMAFDCRGLEPIEFAFMGPQWRVESVGGTAYENVDLSEGEWFEYDEKGSCPVSISKLKSVFDVVKT